MKTIILIILLGFISTTALAKDVHVRGYFKDDGTYVGSYHRSTPDNYKWNNNSNRGN